MTVNGYFDANATTALDPAAREAWLSASWYNPSSLYASAAGARDELEQCRERLGDLLQCEPEDLIFLSGATEANNAVAAWFQSRGQRMAISSIEHPSLSEPAAAAEHIPVEPDGRVSPASIEQVLQQPSRPGLVSLMAANNETGVLQPWQEALALCRSAGVLFHCDAAQWLGKHPAAGLGDCDFVTGSAHKFGGPKGTGFLKVSGGFRWLRGGPQESRRRAGTENLPGIAAMLAALEAAGQRLSRQQHLHEARDAFESAIIARIPGTMIVGATAARLWNTSLLILPAHPNVKWLARLSRLGFEVSTGSACSSGGGASEVLRAMALPEDSLRRVIRVSSTWEHTRTDWLALADAMVRVFADLEAGTA